MSKNHSYIYVLVLLYTILFTSCAKRNYPSSGGSDSIFFPEPPDTARIQFLTRYSNSQDVTGKQKKFKSFVVGNEKVLQVIKPYGVAINKGQIFICDAGILGFEVIDLEKKTFTYFIPGGRGKLKFPINCCFSENGDLYVSDVKRKQIVIFNNKLEYKGEIGGGENFKPTDVFVIGDTILVTDPNNKRINVYDKESNQLLTTFPNAEQGDDNFLYNPTNIFANEDKIYVTDFGDSRIKIFNREGKFINSIGSYGRMSGQFVRPKSIAADREENLFVVDAGFQNVQIFNNEGQLLMFFGGAYNGPGDMYLPAKVTIDYDHVKYFEKFVNPDYRLKYLLFVTNQFGPDKLSVYGRIEPKK